MFPQLRNSSEASSFKNRWIGVCATAFITMVWCDLWYYTSFEELDRNNYGDWFEILCLYLAHVICAFTLLDLCSMCYVRDIYGLFLAASISGWILTGCFQTTFYDTLPVSVSWRGLWWYSIISVFIGLWLIRTLLHSAHKIWLFVGICCISGLMIASWSVWWMHGIGGIDVTIPDITSVAILLFISTGILIISYFMLDKMYDVEDFMPTKIERICVYLSIIFAVFYKIIRTGYLYMFLISWCPTMLVSGYFLIYRYRKISIKIRDNAQVWNALALPHDINALHLNQNSNPNAGNVPSNAASSNLEDQTMVNLEMEVGDLAASSLDRTDRDLTHFDSMQCADDESDRKIGENVFNEMKDIEDQLERHREPPILNPMENINANSNTVPLTQFNLARRDMISDLTDFKYSKSNLWVLLIIPSVGSIAYTVIVHVQQHYTQKLITATVINIAGIFIGFLFMFISIWRIIMLNERVFLRNQYRSHLMEELEMEIEMERAAMSEQDINAAVQEEVSNPVCPPEHGL